MKQKRVKETTYELESSYTLHGIVYALYMALYFHCTPRVKDEWMTECGERFYSCYLMVHRRRHRYDGVNQGILL